MIRVARKPVGILLTVLPGGTPVHLYSHRTGSVRTNSIERASPITGPVVYMLT
jgi:hypothetical protein